MWFASLSFYSSHNSIHRISCLVLDVGQNVRIDIQRQGHRCVAEAVGDGFGVFAVHQE